MKLKREKRVKPGRYILILISMAILVYIVRTSLANQGDEQAGIVPTSPPTATVQDDRPTSLPASLPDEPMRNSPADAWAQAVLDEAMPAISQDAPISDGLAWWQGGGASGVLTVEGESVMIDGQSLELQPTIAIYVPNEEGSRLQLIARIERGENTLTLTIEDGIRPEPKLSWVLSQGDIPAVFASLTGQASDQLLAAYIEQPGEGRIALVGVEGDSVVEAPVVTTPTITPTALPTATRPRDLGMKRVIGEQIMPVIQQAPSFTPNAVYEFAYGHPRVGILSWTESGARVGDQPLALNEATDLTLFALVPDDRTGATERVLTIVYDGRVTRLPDEQMYFQGHRIEEMIYWMVRIAAEEGGQLEVVHDDFGVKQTITFIGFEPFD